MYQWKQVCSFARLFAKLTRQETAKLPLRSSSQAATFYYQRNHSKVEAIFF